MQRRTLLTCAASVAANAVATTWSQAAGDNACHGALVLCGGGKPFNDDVFDTFWELAGRRDARIVLVPTAHPDMDQPASASKRIELLSAPWRKRVVASFEVCHMLMADEANQPAFAKPLATATGMWFGGGDQSRLLSAYRDTRFFKQLLAWHHRGGVIGGSSAGTAVQSEMTIVGQRDEQTLVEPGFNLLPGTVLDQHFLARSRLARLQEVVRRYPKLIGIGIDEYTALVVQASKVSVVGKSSVTFTSLGTDGKFTTGTYAANEAIPDACFRSPLCLEAKEPAP